MIGFSLLQNGKLVDQENGLVIVPWWSFTKTILATAALCLVRDDLLHLDELLPGRPFTLRQLLRHQAGLTDYGALAEYHAAVDSGADAWPAEDMLERANAEVLRYKPGEGWSYSNIGYLYVRRLVEEVTGESLDAALKKLVLQPLGLEGPSVAMSRGSATNYDPRWVYHGLLVGSLQDAATLLNRILTQDLLPVSLKREMLDSYVVTARSDDGLWLERGYGLGLMIQSTQERAQLVGHSGAGPGSNIAVYHSSAAIDVTCATFAVASDQHFVESSAVRMLKDSQ